MLLLCFRCYAYTRLCHGSSIGESSYLESFPLEIPHPPPYSRLSFTHCIQWLICPQQSYQGNNHHRPPLPSIPFRLRCSSTSLHTSLSLMSLPTHYLCHHQSPSPPLSDYKYLLVMVHQNIYFPSGSRQHHPYPAPSAHFLSLYQNLPCSRLFSKPHVNVSYLLVVFIVRNWNVIYGK